MSEGVGNPCEDAQFVELGFEEGGGCGAGPGLEEVQGGSGEIWRGLVVVV